MREASRTPGAVRHSGHSESLKGVDKELDRRKAVVQTSRSMREAGERLAIDGSRLTDWFRRRGVDPLELLIKPEAKPAAPPIDPIQRAETERAEARVRREHAELLKEVATLRTQAAIRERLSSEPLKPIKRREFKSGMREATAVALLSDMHVEERVLATDTPTGNVYNLDVADLRLARFFTGVEWLINKERATSKIRDLILWFGGDLASGHIHEENVETSAFPPIAAMLWLQPRLYSGVLQLKKRLGLERILIPCSYGNHGRDTKKPRRATGAHHSYEWGMYQQLAQLFKGQDGIEVLANPSAHQYLTAYDFELHFHHGDETNYQGGVGGITIPVNKAVAAWDKVRRCDFHHFGHWHQYIDLGNWVGNGSGIGYNAYAMSIKASPEPPQQAFYLLDSKRAKTAKSPIWVTDSGEEAKLVKGAA